MRYGRRGYGRRQEYYQENDDITFDEFKFYVNKENLIAKSELKKMEINFVLGKPFYWTNDEYAKHNIFFEFYIETKNDAKGVPQSEKYVHLKETEFTFNKEDLLNTKLRLGPVFLTFDIEKPEHYVDTIGNLKFKNGKEDIKEAIVCKTFDELISFFIENKLISDSGGEFHEYEFNSISEFLFKIKPEEIKYNTNESGRRGSSYTYHIFKVIEKRINNKNYRIAFINKATRYDTYYQFRIVDENDPTYNYYDENRVFIKQYRTDKFCFLPENTAIIGEDKSVTIDYDTCDLLVDNVHDVLGEDEYIVSANIFRFYSEQVKRHEIYDEKVDAHEKAIIEQYFKILKMGRIIKMDQVIMDKSTIKTEDDMFKIEFDNNFFDIEKNFVKLKREIEKGDAKYNFNILYELILKFSKLNIIQMYNTTETEYKEFTSSKFIVNGMEIIVSKENNRIKINNSFCRIDDVQDILSKAICYNNIDDFNKYVNDVSHIGLEWKKLINNGLMLYLENPLFRGLQKIGKKSQEKVIMRFSLLWDDMRRNKVYLLVNGEKYLIKYKGKFIKFFNTPEKRIRLAKLKIVLKDTLEEFDDDSIFTIVTNAIEEAKIIQARGKELVECTIKDTKAKETTITISDGNVKGFEIVGLRTGVKYFIDGNSLNVFRWENGKWNRRCIVSDPNKQRIFEDRLANRLINIYNENAKIYTLFN